MTRLNKKQALNLKTLYIANDIHCSLLPPDTPPTLDETRESFPEVSHYKSQETGEVRVGLSMKGIRNLVKRYPMISTEAVRVWFNMDPVEPMDTLVPSGPMVPLEEEDV